LKGYWADWRVIGGSSRIGETGVRDTSRNLGKQGEVGWLHAEARRRGGEPALHSGPGLVLLHSARIFRRERRLI
jgi:hypothetical protein